MPFPMQTAQSLAQFAQGAYGGYGGGMPGRLFDRARYEQSYQQGRIPGSPGYEAAVQQNPGIDPQTGQPWQATDQGGWGQYQRQGPETPPTGGYTQEWWNSLDPREQAWRESQAIREPMGRQRPPMGPGQAQPYALPQPGGPQPAPYAQPSPTQMRHNQWLQQHGGMMPLGQFAGGLAGAFPGIRR